MKLNPYLAIILAATIGGANGVFVKLIDLPSTTISFFRMVVPVVFLLLYFSWKKVKIWRGNYKIMLLASVLNAGRMFLYFLAYLYTSIGNGVIILFTWPIFATIFGVLILKEKVTKRNMLLIGLAFAGIVLMYLNKEISLDSKDFLGMAFMLISAIMFALTAVIFKKQLTEYSKTETIFFQNLVGAAIFFPFIFFNRPLPSLGQATVGVIYGLIVGIFAFSLFFYALKKLKMSHYSLFTYWEVPAALIFGVFFFDEKITWNIIVGGILIIISGWLLRKKKTNI